MGYHWQVCLRAHLWEPRHGYCYCCRVLYHYLPKRHLQDAGKTASAAANMLGMFYTEGPFGGIFHDCRGSIPTSVGTFVCLTLFIRVSRIVHHDTFPARGGRLGAALDRYGGNCSGTVIEPLTSSILARGGLHDAGYLLDAPAVAYGNGKIQHLLSSTLESCSPYLLELSRLPYSSPPQLPYRTPNTYWPRPKEY